jgi:DNA-binding transcriptional ArsR family regulator
MKRLSTVQLDAITTRARALADPTRVRILDFLARGPQPVGRIAAALECEPSTVSKHLQVLFHARLVARQRAASTVIYSVADLAIVQWVLDLGRLPTRGGQGRVG